MFRLPFSRRIAAMVLALGVASVAHAQGMSTPPGGTPAPSATTPVGPPVDDPALKKNLETRLEVGVDSITKLPVDGLYEVRAGDEVFYTDKTGNFIMVGNLIDLRTKENITRTRLLAIKEASLPPFKFNELPLDAAVKVVKGSGKRRVAIFEDPNCVYCKKLEKSILDVGNVTIYVFLYPILGPDSLVKSKQVWCADNRSKAWVDWMQKATAPSGEAKCNTATLDKTLALGKKLQVEGTPTLFFGNNRRIEGVVDAGELERMLGTS
jgi:thiol:disulfide interchange protein DsbC